MAGVAFGHITVSFFVAGAAFGDIAVSLLVVGAALGDVGVLLFVVGAAFGEIWVNSRSTKYFDFQCRMYCRRGKSQLCKQAGSVL